MQGYKLEGRGEDAKPVASCLPCFHRLISDRDTFKRKPNFKTHGSNHAEYPTCMAPVNIAFGETKKTIVSRQKSVKPYICKSIGCRTISPNRNSSQFAIFDSDRKLPNEMPTSPSNRTHQLNQLAHGSPPRDVSRKLTLPCAARKPTVKTSLRL